MKWPLLVSLLILIHWQPEPGLFSSNPSQSVPSFQVSMLFTIQPSGYTLDYQVSQDSLNLHYNCAFVKCKDTLLYGIRLDPGVALKYYKYIRILNLDSLQNINETKGFEGVSILVSIHGTGIKLQSLLTVHPEQPILARLIARTNSLIADPKYRYRPPPQQ
ncbi:MAG TPA: hypothetical protein VNE41_04015 [Chitinophagaceae bacterium]|nr:hypothetical protein [Chitinophagaceae bacterium]